MTHVRFYETIDDELLKFAVIIAKTDGKWVFCKHKERDTYEVPGGHREAGETILETARRELYEETGATQFEITPICVYSVTAPDNFDGKETFGMLYYADIVSFETELHSEIEKIHISEQLVENWTYPLIQPKLIAEAEKRGKLYRAYKGWLEKMKNDMGADSEEFIAYKAQFTKEFRNGVEKDSMERQVLIQNDKVTIRMAHISDADFISEVERDADNCPWVANWPLSWRIAKMGDPDFLQVIVERADNIPIGFIIFRNMLQKETAVELKRIALADKGKGYGKETLYLAQKLAFEVFGTKRLFLHTKVDNLRAQSIYKATGFTPETPDPCVSFYMDVEDYKVKRKKES